jgi:uncharacterized membrane protein YcaP (DUF421 family)
MEIIETLWGHGEHLNMVQMAARAFVMFFIMLALIRVTGMRAFGFKSAFDSIVTLMLGAILARGVVGASPFFSTVAASLMICLLHRGLAYAAMKNDTLSHLLKSKEVKVVENGKVIQQNMEKCQLSMGDLMEGLRDNGNINDIKKAKEAYMERTGTITVIKDE